MRDNFNWILLPVYEYMSYVLSFYLDNYVIFLSLINVFIRGVMLIYIYIYIDRNKGPVLLIYIYF